MIFPLAYFGHSLIPGEETRFNLDGPELETGKALLIKDTVSNSVFTANNIQKKTASSPSKDQTNSQKVTDTKPLPPEETETQSIDQIVQQNGGLPNSLRLPPIKLQKILDKHDLRKGKPKRKRRRMEDDKKVSSQNRKRKDSTHSGSSAQRENPMDNRSETPEILSSEKFDYIKPIYTPLPPSRPTTTKSLQQEKSLNSRAQAGQDEVVNRSMQTESNV